MRGVDAYTNEQVRLEADAPTTDLSHIEGYDRRDGLVEEGGNQ